MARSESIPHLTLTLLAGLIATSGCDRSAEREAVTPIDFGGRSTYRECAMTTPLVGKWEAGISHGYYSDDPNQDYDFLEVTLELPGLDGNIVVPFEAAYSLSDLPKDILDQETADLVSFDEESQTVTFDLGTTKATTRIPR